MTTPEDAHDKLAREFIDQILEINSRYGMGGTVSLERYETAVRRVRRSANGLYRAAPDVDRAAIIAYLQAHPGASQREVRTSVRGSATLVTEALRRLVAAGAVVATPRSGRGGGVSYTTVSGDM